MIEITRPPGEVRLAVIDNGVGLTDEVERQIFTRFFTTEESRGTGLGLAVCHKQVSESGGLIEGESGPGPFDQGRITAASGWPARCGGPATGPPV